MKSASIGKFLMRYSIANDRLGLKVTDIDFKWLSQAF